MAKMRLMAALQECKLRLRSDAKITTIDSAFLSKKKEYKEKKIAIFLTPFPLCSCVIFVALVSRYPIIRHLGVI